MKQVNDINHLRSLIEEGNHDFFIKLNFGMRSSKTIDIDDDGKFCITNEIDGTEDLLTEVELQDRNITNIGYAISVGAFYCY